MNRYRVPWLSLALVAAALLTAGCAPSPPAPAAPAASPAVTAASQAVGTAAAAGPKPRIAVGSKNFTEQLVVGQMVAALLEDAGYPVDRKLNLGGTAVVHQALVNGEVDTYVEYTGTGLIALLKLPQETDAQK